MVHKFKLAPLDKTARLLSNPITIALSIFSGIFWWVLLFPFSPRSYIVSSQGITIRAPFISYVIPRNNIKSFEIVEHLKPGVGLTWFSGLFGYAGLFSLADGSTAKVYATRWDRMVRIQVTNGDPYFLSPAEPETFVEVANKLILGK